MENRQDDEEVELVTVGAGVTVNKGSSPPTKKRRLTRVANKGGSSSSSFVSTRSSARSTARTLATIAEVETAEVEEDEEPLVRKARKGRGTTTAEAETEAAAAEEVEEPPKRKAHKAKVPFYYDKKAFTVSATSCFVKQLEKENWKEFMSFVKDNADPAEPTVEGSAALGVVETDLDPLESQETREMVPVQDPRPDVVMAEPFLQPELRPDVVVERSRRTLPSGRWLQSF